MSLGAIPGTGPNTSPLSVVRKSKRKTFAELPTGRTLVMGILNVTEDSFSDGGQYLAIDKALDHGLKLLYAGADIIDVGGESTRPGAKDVDPALEQARINSGHRGVGQSRCGDFRGHHARIYRPRGNYGRRTPD